MKPISPIIDRVSVRYAVETYYDFQHLRIVVENQLRAIEQAGGNADLYRDLFFVEIASGEKRMLKELKRYAEQLPIWNTWLKGVLGVGPVIVTGLDAMIDISRFDNVAKLWAYAGLHVIDGVAAKRKKGEKANWNPRLKNLAWKISESFVKTKGGYRGEYDRAKLFYQTKFPDYTKLHIHNMAKRKAVKLFLSHYWSVSRGLAGLPTRPPYAIEKLGHTTYIEPYTR